VTAGDQDPSEDIQYHLKLREGGYVASTVLFPGDPDRGHVITALRDTTEADGSNRE